MSGVMVRIDKEEVTEAASVVAGNTLTYSLNWTLNLPVDATAFSDVTVTDVLGVGLEYVLGSASQPPSNIQFNMDGTTTLTWEFVDIETNVVQPNITYDATVLTTAEDASSVINTATVDAPTDPSSESERSDVESLVVSNTTLFGVDKEVLTPVVGRDGIVEFRLSYLNNGTSPVNNIRFIDILPDVALANPPSAFAGSIEWVSFTDTTGTITAYYTKTPAPSVNIDPADASNDLNTGSVAWCDDFNGSGVPSNPGLSAVDCPQSAAEVEAVYFYRPSMPGKTGPHFITLTLEASNITQDETFLNRYGLSADELGATLTTEVVAAVVGAADLEIEKIRGPRGRHAWIQCDVFDHGQKSGRRCRSCRRGHRCIAGGSQFNLRVG